MGRRNDFADVFKHIDMRPVAPSTCWLWKGPLNDKGLAYFQVDGRKYSAPRLVYWITHPEWDIDNKRSIIRHKCVDLNGLHVDNGACCNPEHMEPGNHRDNMLDMMLRGRKGIPKEALFDVLDLHKRLPDLTHSQIAARVSFKHKVPIARQTVTDILNYRRRKVLRDARDAENREIDEGEP